MSSESKQKALESALGFMEKPVGQIKLSRLMRRLDRFLETSEERKERHLYELEMVTLIGLMSLSAGLLALGAYSLFLHYYPHCVQVFNATFSNPVCK